MDGADKGVLEKEKRGVLFENFFFFVSGFNYSFHYIDQGRSSAVLCGPPISLEMEMNYPYLHGCHRSTNLLECRPTEILGPESCFVYHL